jgi:beta-phosphoglucomutase-like phosphatase (HAD superfamily)
VSAERDGRELVRGAGVLALCDAVVDGRDIEQGGWAGPPDPAVMFALARSLGTGRSRTVLIHSALAGVSAGRRAGFGGIVAVDRSRAPHGRSDLIRAGADLVVRDTSELLLRPALQDAGDSHGQRTA